MVENAEGQARQEDQVGHGAIDEEDPHRIAARVQEKEDPEGEDVTHEAKDEEHGVHDCQSHLEGRVFKCAFSRLVAVVDQRRGGAVEGRGGKNGGRGRERGRHRDEVESGRSKTMRRPRRWSPRALRRKEGRES